MQEAFHHVIEKLPRTVWDQSNYPAGSMDEELHLVGARTVRG